MYLFGRHIFRCACNRWPCLAGRVDEGAGSNVDAALAQRLLRVAPELRMECREEPVEAAAARAPHLPVGRDVGPALTEARPGGHSLDVVGRVARVGGDGVADRVIGPGARLLDVVNVATEPAKALQVVQHLPRHACERCSPNRA